MGIESKNDQECLIMGKGVAFGKKVGQTVSVTGDASAAKTAVLNARQIGLELLIAMGSSPEIPGTPYL